MISSGMKRGLAAAAVSALAVAGLPFLATSASATPINSQVPDANTVELAAPESAVVSSKNDGTDSTTRFEAAGGANIAQVKFEYSLDAGANWTSMGTVSSRNDNGAFALDWNVSPIVGATGVTFRATGLAADGTTTVDTDTDGGYTVNNTADTVDLASGNTVGVFQQPYSAPDDNQNVIVSGTTSDPTQVVQFWRWNNTSFTNTSSTATATPVSGTTHGKYTGVVDITGYTYGSGDQLLLESYLATDTTDDAEAYDLYKQTITTVTATASATDVPAGDPAPTVTVTVNDQNGNPIAGARVLDASGVTTHFTDEKGKATFTQNQGTSTFYYADATNVAGYNPELNDKKSDTVTITQYNAVQTSFAASSVDGDAFDYDEYASGDIKIQLKDQKGHNMAAAAGQNAIYQWFFTPFGGGAQVALAQTPAVPNGGGSYTVEFPQNGDPLAGGGVFARPANGGTFTLGAGLTADGLGNGAVAGAALHTYKAGQSTLAWTSSDPVQAAQGGSADVAGKLTLADGTGLAGRSVDATYGGGSNAGIVQANGTLAASRTVTTGADGGYSVTVKDPAAPATEEIGHVSAMTVAGTTDGDNPGASVGNIGVEFRLSLAPAAITFSPMAPNGDNPGELKGYTAHVVGDSDPATPGVQAFDLNGVTVNLTTDHGYFTDGTPDPAPAEGAAAGSYKPLTSVKTDGSGDADVYLAIGRDAGFDDDGEVTSSPSATAGSVTDNTGNDWTWNSDNPLNPGSVVLERADEQTVTILPKAPTNESVFYDAYAKDQFGNLVGGQPIHVDGGFPGNGDDVNATSQFAGEGPNVELMSDTAGTVTPEASWTSGTYVYGAGPGFTPGAGPNKTVTDEGENIEWYVIDFANSTYTLENDANGETVPVGGTVLETYTAIDQNGEPIYGVTVGFFRTGPDDYQDGDDFNSFGVTNEDGQYSYVFAGAKAGTATVQALITDWSPLGGDQVVPQSRATDTVTFGNEKQNIQLKVTGKSKGSKDEVKANANDFAAGLTAFLYKGGEVIKTHALDASGDFTFKVKDTNGNKKTKYTVKVLPTDTTNGASKSVKIK